MQIFRFIFMHRNWAADQKNLGLQLKKLGERASRSMKPFVLLICACIPIHIRKEEEKVLTFAIVPEGTLVSPLTRPPSAAYAKKMDIPDCRNCLLPRSTGLLFCLRSLSPRVPTLRLLDVTIGYPGIPPAKFGQDYYTLQSIFGRGVSPPMVHMHLKSYNVKYDVPIGRDSLSHSSTTGADATEAEKKEFDAWLLQRWREKDDRLDMFLDSERLSMGSKFVDIPLQIRTPWELAGMLVTAVSGLYLTKIVAKFAWRVLVRGGAPW